MKRLLILVYFFTAAASADYLDCPCKVVKVVDGDTIHVLDRGRSLYKIRLGGIDAPERKQAFGRKSTRNLAKYIAGEFVEVEYNKTDHYGRIIGKVLKDRLDINLQQVRDGYAWHYERYQNEQSATDRRLYSEAELSARQNRIGLWVEAAIPPWEFRRRN